MSINEYLNRINSESQAIFKESVKEEELFEKAHRMSSCVFTFAQILTNTSENKMLTTVSELLEAASMNMSLGFYRQAFSTLKHALELGLGAIYYSVYKMEEYDWQQEITTVDWHKIMDKDTGILSSRFAKAFYPEMEEAVKHYHESVAVLYRKLSEGGLGNSERWDWGFDGITLRYNPAQLKKYFALSAEVAEAILLLMFCRYARNLSIEQLDLVPGEVDQIPAIRRVLTGEE
ncbi:hypothetical protein [Chitinophaga sp. Cy-1792]|uniref:hypothetical protein n=1 Tax=Chitinophaga sp. Cy-1792 TaxID=2608339 RepID=UPI00141DE07D|nr:hypothetical protein [Chitinophaga sp. Cy-1792]NIG55839.1 hypothetical protein [Chitinophaga sp. Cy-1792]